MTRVFIWKNNSPQEWEEISFSAFSKARRNGCFTGRFFVETVKMFRDEDDRIIMECSRKDFEKYQQEDRHSRYLQEHEKSRSIFPASHVGDRDGTEEGYQDTDLFVDESVDIGLSLLFFKGHFTFSTENMNFLGGPDDGSATGANILAGT